MEVNNPEVEKTNGFIIEEKPDYNYSVFVELELVAELKVEFKRIHVMTCTNRNSKKN